MIGERVMHGDRYNSSTAGTIIRSTPTQWVVRMDNERECRLRRDTMIEICSGHVTPYRIIPESRVAAGRERCRDDEAKMNALQDAHCELWHAMEKMRPVYGMSRSDIADIIRRKTLVDIELATKQILECANTLRKLVGVTNG